MPSRSARETPVNERISQAQRNRTRLACSSCRARRIKCDGAPNVCGRCREDMRPDCQYEIVSISERTVGCQRKRTLRKQQSSDPTLGTMLLSPMHTDTYAVGSSSMLSTGGSALPTHPYSLASRQTAPGEWDWQGLMHPSSQLQMDNRVESTHSECSSLSTQPSSCHAATPDDVSAFFLPWSGLPLPADGERLAIGSSTAWQPAASDLHASEASTAMAYGFDLGGDTLQQPDSTSKAGVLDSDCTPADGL